ncbi:hypothetical protein BaRGS_00002571 [Batillaria attramentaria]|uniref:Uncharacterized protein n=1 Tax=Batillaria attramentaria TaxID=370345 RepID=A0ABD0M3R0_9CAEN
MQRHPTVRYRGCLISKHASDVLEPPDRGTATVSWHCTHRSVLKDVDSEDRMATGGHCGDPALGPCHVMSCHADPTLAGRTRDLRGLRQGSSKWDSVSVSISSWNWSERGSPRGDQNPDSRCGN